MECYSMLMGRCGCLERIRLDNLEPKRKLAAKRLFKLNFLKKTRSSLQTLRHPNVQHPLLSTRKGLYINGALINSYLLNIRLLIDLAL